MGKGYGKLLLQTALKELYELGFKDIFLWVLEENMRARRFYEKLGFRYNGIYKEENIGGKILRELQYVGRALACAERR